MKRLSARERLFVEEKAKGLDGVKAIIAAGFKGKRPDVAAAKIMAKANVLAALEAKLAAIAKKAEVTQEDWFREVWGVASTKIAKAKITGSDKNKALELAGRALGAFKDTAGEREQIGPGLTIVIQQAINGTAAPVTTTVAATPPAGFMPGPQR